MRLFKGYSYASSIKQEYFPFINLRTKYARFFTNFEVDDMNHNKWSIGSIPRVRISKMNKFKSKVKHSINEEVEQDEVDEYKLIGKRNIYFHRNYFTHNPFIYSHETKFPPVLSMFRQYETKSVKRIKQSVKKKRQSLINHDKYIAQEEDLGTKYYNGSDGLYFSGSNQDDNPDDNKLGWITIYDDETLSNKGMFEFVLGMTLAVGFDSCLSD
ncbi:uncharacterized protein SPAPADRAFT_60309 [Spathaspora passalidarum NRRL Y-27907]|uniref:Uncharacterized protein n=1 Tax=Spathaspora passalidarum (strain NRRL Y-27907 / 11-Y1) TaxID=619300 RepID=G3AKS7_SPAPN|nr:uncharacterized protein SPAPADRAFT_60309 [Spathaspora passalidarum NRRL Y-27907]EGW32981.1 hypothetical protein SPAPADRAFT_60309 [Spathaspora passalidarum NRRL Y-27907]